MIRRLNRKALVAWAAGFFDGEGSVTLAAGNPGHGQRRHAGQMKLAISVWQTQKAPLLRLQMLFGGTIYANPQRSPRHAPSWAWRLHDQQAMDALLEMEPYLIRKAAQAAVARDFRVLVTGTTWGPPGMPDEEIAKRVALKEAMTVLNAKGPQP